MGSLFTVRPAAENTCSDDTVSSCQVCQPQKPSLTFQVEVNEAQLNASYLDGNLTNLLSRCT